MRTTKELIEELEAEWCDYQHAAIVVGFNTSTIPIFSTDYNRLQLLNDAVSVGGSPLGLIAIDQSVHDLKVTTHVYPENVGDEGEQADQCLNALSQVVRDTLSARRQPGVSGRASASTNPIEILKSEQDGKDGILVTFSDGTNAGYVVEELIALRPSRQSVRISDADMLTGEMMLRS